MEVDRRALREIEVAKYIAAIRETVAQLSITMSTDKQVALIWQLAYQHLRNIEDWREP